MYFITTKRMLEVCFFQHTPTFIIEPEIEIWKNGFAVSRRKYMRRNDDIGIHEIGNRMKLKKVFFDLDGTLTDSMPGITKGVQYALKHYGIQVDDLNVLKPFVGPPLSDSFKEYYNFSEEDAEDAIYVFREYYDVEGWKDNAPFAGVEEMLKSLKDAGLELYVATSKPEVTAKRVLEYFHLTNYFKFIGGASLDEKRVNKDDVIRYVLEENGIGEEEKKSVIMVGDRKHDVEGAKKTGLSVVGVLYGYGSREELQDAGADYLCETPREVAELLRSLAFADGNSLN